MKAKICEVDFIQIPFLEEICQNVELDTYHYSIIPCNLFVAIFDHPM